MAGEWVTFYLGEVCTKIGSGATPRGGSSVYLDRGEIALIRSQNIYNEGFRREGLAFITPEHARELEQVEVMPGDVLLNITGDSVARCCLVDESILPARVNQHVAIVRADPHKLDSRFLRYFLVCPNVQARMVSWAGSGGTRNALTKAMIESFDVHAPRDLGEQRAIAHILGTLDDKIDLNRRMNETLEAMARAIFKSWFVDFDPVRAKAEGRKPFGMDAATAALFPDSFDDSSLGKIPKGWRVGLIGDVVNAVGGSTPRTEEPTFWNGDFNFCTPKDMASLRSPILLDTERRITEAGLKEISSGLLPRGTLLLSSRAPIGYLAITEIPVAVNQGIIAAICDKELPNFYVLHWVRENMETIVANANGTTFLEISKKNFRPINVLVPPEAILAKYVQVACPLHERIVGNVVQSRTLAAIRDALLPKLISGEIRVKNAIEPVEMM
jgi:type I restriction enzyme S subunit